MTIKRITLGELRVRLLNTLNSLDDDVEVTFGGGQLSLYRPKWRGDKLMDIEFSEVFTVQFDPAADN